MFRLGVTAFVFKKTGFSINSAGVDLVLRAIAELNINGSLMLSGGDYCVFISSPIAII